MQNLQSKAHFIHTTAKRPLTKPGSDSGSARIGLLIGSDSGPDLIGIVLSLLVHNYYFEKICFNNDTGGSE